MLQLHNISKTYNQNPVLDGVSFELGIGCYGIIGNNGCGKSTLLNIIAGSTIADSGQVFYNSNDISQQDVLNRALLGFGVMFQEGGFVPDLSVFDNLKLTLLGPVTTWRELWRAGITSAFDKQWNQQIKNKINQILTKYHLIDNSSTLAIDLSGGQKKLLQFARLDLSESKVWLLDEPLAGVSQQNIPLFQKIILDAKFTKTIILVEHNIEFVNKVSDQVFEIKDGKLKNVS